MILVVGIIAAVVFVWHNRDSSTTTTVSNEVFAAPADQVGANPFTDSISAPAPSSTAPSATVAPAAIVPSQQEQSGATRGLYGGTRNKATCDREQMISFLEANPAKARAWADVEEIPVADVPSYIRSLTPVVLRADTRVVNHGFANGKATAFQAVLQAGTAVLIDDYGVPRARCYCGNPLLPPPQDAPRYTGTFWPAFSPTAVVVITPAPSPITVVVLVDIVHGGSFGRPVHSAGGGDVDTPPPTNGSTTTSASASDTNSSSDTSSDSSSSSSGGGSLPDASGTDYTLTFGTTSFSGTPTGVQTPAICSGFDGFILKEKLSIDGTNATLDDGSSGLATGTFDPATRKFSVSETSNVNGNEIVYKTSGTIADDGTIDGNWSSNALGSDATCSTTYHAVPTSPLGSGAAGVFKLVNSTHSINDPSLPWVVDDKAGKASLALTSSTPSSAHFFWDVPQTIDPAGTGIRWGGYVQPNGADVLIYITVSGKNGIKFDTSDLTVNERGGEQAKEAVVSVTGNATEVTLQYSMSDSVTATYTYRR